MTNTPYLFRNIPHLVPKVWGGRRLEELLGKQLPGAGAFGESWEVADLPEGTSSIGNGPWRGRTLREAVDAWGADLIGRAAPGPRFPLLVKVLDACDDLSVQVHPGKQHRAALPDARPKDESWVILDATDEGAVLHGLRDEAETAETLQAALRSGDLVSRVRKVPVRAGDVLRVPAGCIHAICRGVMLLEVQEPSDTTYRVYDYERPGLDGALRPLHLEQAMHVARFGPQPDPITTTTRADADATHRVLLNTHAYRVELLRLSTPLAWPVNPDSPQLLFALSGEVELSGPRERVTLRAGQSAIAPASLGGLRARPLSGHTELVLSGLGDIPLIPQDRLHHEHDARDAR